MITYFLLFTLAMCRAYKICSMCKYFVKDDKNIKNSKCSYFPVPQVESDLEKHNRNLEFLVTGIQDKYINEMDWQYCSKARKNEDMCGINGKLFVEQPKFYSPYRGSDI